MATHSLAHDRRRSLNILESWRKFHAPRLEAHRWLLAWGTGICFHRGADEPPAIPRPNVSLRASRRLLPHLFRSPALPIHTFRCAKELRIAGMSSIRAACLSRSRTTRQQHRSQGRTRSDGVSDGVPPPSVVLAILMGLLLDVALAGELPLPMESVFERDDCMRVLNLQNVADGLPSDGSEASSNDGREIIVTTRSTCRMIQ